MESYPKSEMDLILKALDTELKNNHREVMLALEEQKTVHKKLETAISDVDTKISYTNGKVKRIVIALVAIGAFALGTGLQNISTLLKFIL